MAAHSVLILGVLASSEPFGRVDVSSRVLIGGLGLLLLCYLVFRAIHLEYVTRFELAVAFSHVLVWVAVLFTYDDWSNIIGWDRLVYIVYPIFAGTFFLGLTVMNLVVFLIRTIWKGRNKEEESP